MVDMDTHGCICPGTPLETCCVAVYDCCVRKLYNIHYPGTLVLHLYKLTHWLCDCRRLGSYVCDMSQQNKHVSQHAALG